MNLPENLKYTKDHEWIKVEDGVGTIGVTDYAQGELGDVVYVDIEEDLEEIVKEEAFGTIEAVKTVSDLYAPVDGKVTELNAKLADEAGLVNTDPYGEGWLLKVELSDESQLDELLTAAEYKEHVGQ